MLLLGVKGTQVAFFCGYKGYENSHALLREELGLLYRVVTRNMEETLA